MSGHAHYWRVTEKPEVCKIALAHISNIVMDGYEAGILINDQKGAKSRQPIVTAKLIYFNGIGKLGYAPFDYDPGDISLGMYKGRYYSQCMTGCRRHEPYPYNEYVMRVLLVLKAFQNHDLELTSDGRFDEEWMTARLDIEEMLGIKTKEEELGIRYQDQDSETELIVEYEDDFPRHPKA